MKKLLIALFALCLLLPGCSKAPESTPNLPVFTPPTTTHGHEHTPTQPNASRPTQPTPAPTEPDLGPATFTMYLPNENSDGFVENNVTIDHLYHGGIMVLLMVRGVVNEGVQANFCTREDKALHLDLNEEFLNQLQTLDANAERMLVGSIVNTFLSAYDCDSILLTVHGKAITSGSIQYDSPLSFFE